MCTQSVTKQPRDPARCSGNTSLPCQRLLQQLQDSLLWYRTAPRGQQEIPAGWRLLQLKQGWVCSIPTQKPRESRVHVPTGGSGWTNGLLAQVSSFIHLNTSQTAPAVPGNPSAQIQEYLLQGKSVFKKRCSHCPEKVSRSSCENTESQLKMVYEKTQKPAGCIKAS